MSNQKIILGHGRDEKPKSLEDALGKLLNLPEETIQMIIEAYGDAIMNINTQIYHIKKSVAYIEEVIKKGRGE